MLLVLVSLQQPFLCAFIAIAFLTTSFLSHFDLPSTGNRDSSGATDPIENRTPLASIKDNGLGASEKGDYATVRALVNFIKHSESDPWYTACTTPGCSKKVVEGAGGNWTCEKCNLTIPEVSVCDVLYFFRF